jgi:hypothetical protein
MWMFPKILWNQQVKTPLKSFQLDNNMLLVQIGTGVLSIPVNKSVVVMENLTLKCKDFEINWHLKQKLHYTISFKFQMAMPTFVLILHEMNL